MKRVLASVCAAALALSLAACGAPASESSSAAEGSSTPASESSSAAEESSEPAAETGSDLGSITVVTREDGSGTRGAFIELTGVETDEGDMTIATAQVANSTNNVMTSVQAEPSAIGYISMGSLNETVKGIAVDGVEPTEENIASGEYALGLDTLALVSSSAAADSGERALWLWLQGGVGQAFISSQGYMEAVR